MVGFHILVNNYEVKEENKEKINGVFEEFIKRRIKSLKEELLKDYEEFPEGYEGITKEKYLEDNILKRMEQYKKTKERGFSPMVFNITNNFYTKFKRDNIEGGYRDIYKNNKEHAVLFNDVDGKIDKLSELEKKC